MRLWSNTSADLALSTEPVALQYSEGGPSSALPMRPVSAWLVTWEATHPRLLPKKRLAGIFDGRLGSDEVRQRVQTLYASHAYTETDMLVFRLDRANPYRASFGEHQGIIECGHNPHLYARKVDGLENGHAGKVRWVERPQPKLRKR